MYQIMIVDDEPVIREGITNFIDWDALDCKIAYIANNGIEALEYMKASPINILITDIRMPGLNGLELIHALSTHQIACKTIVISGYSDFHYAQEAVKLGVIDFILKDNPLEPLVSAIKKAIDLIEEEAQQNMELSRLEAQFNENFKELRSKFFIDLIHKTILSDQAISEKKQALCADLSDYCILVVQTESTKPKYSSIEGSPQKLLYSLTNFMCMLFKQYIYSIFAIESNSLCVVLSDNKLSIEDVLSQCEYLFKLSGQMISHLSMKIGISQIHSHLDGFSPAYEEALMTLNSLKPNQSLATYALSISSTTLSSSIRAAISYMEANYSSDLSLNVVASEIGLNPSYLSRTFKKETGFSLTEFLTSCRIEKAKELLTTQDWKMLQITEASGFHDTAYFSNAFKKATGYSPSEYRTLRGKR